MNVQFCCLARNISEVSPATPTFLHFSPRLLSVPSLVVNAQVVLAGEPVSTAVALLRAGARKVLLGEAALLDGTAVQQLVSAFGSGRVGLHAPVQRQAVNWTIETESNEDFSVITPSVCEPVWEVLKANGETSGVRAVTWVSTLIAQGASTVLLRADIEDDADLNLCAGMVEAAGEKLWVAPLAKSTPVSTPVFADWIEFGQVARLALPTALYANRHALVKRCEDQGALHATV